MLKKSILILLVLVLLSGCTITRIDNYDYDKLMNKVLSLDLNIHNKIGKGYKYYAPKGIVRTNSSDYNDILERRDVKYYLYVDVVSYYYKNKFDYKIDKTAYHSKLINKNGKKGYLEIKKVKNKLYVQMVYNYAKIEAYINESQLESSITDISYILSSVEFNDSLLKKMYESGSFESKEEVYKLFDNKENKGNFLEYIKEYDKYDGSNDSSTKEEEIEVKETTTTKKEETTTKKEDTTTSVVQ